MASPRRKTGPSRATPARPLEILLIEDTPTEARRTKRALRQGRIRSRITVVEDGEQALALLRSQPELRPDVILLDWYLPRKGGREVLDDLKSDPAFRHVPIVVLSISDRQEDVAAAYDGHANSFVTKPADLEQFARVLKLVEVLWKRRLPDPSEGSDRVPPKRKTKPR
jgi:two-component system, chemotaxis family, response regulator Rcp1